ncbi:MAG: putative 2OG-Fe(II) oxygenase [Candidatus Neomarinimicrobiota bacterium]
MDKSKFNCVEYFPKILDLYHDKIINSIYQNRKRTTYSHKINGRWENQYLSIKYFPELRKLFRTACLEGKAILEKSLVVPYKELGLPMDEFWFNIAGPGESTGWHDHKKRSELSGVYYLHVPYNSGDIHFRKKIDAETFEWEKKSQTGKLILFDSNIEHSVPENKSKENRISIAFNLFSLPLKIGSVNSVYSSNKFYS